MTTQARIWLIVISVGLFSVRQPASDAGIFDRSPGVLQVGSPEFLPNVLQGRQLKRCCRVSLIGAIGRASHH
jgi:hypothetical protein